MVQLTVNMQHTLSLLRWYGATLYCDLFPIEMYKKKSIIIYYCIIPKIVTQSIRMLTTTLKFMNLNPAGTLKFVKF